MSGDDHFIRADNDCQAVQALPHEIAEARRKCWHSDCNKTAWLEWCGWRYCLWHYWTQVIRDADGWKHKLEKVRWTQIARR